MAEHSALRIATLSLLLLLSIRYSPVLGYSIRSSNSQLTLSDNPSAVVIKVGDNASVSLALTTSEMLREACFGEEGFPSSGFILTFLPQCLVTQTASSSAALIVEATPAAAPQNFTALIVATIGNQTASTPLTVTVVPAISPWIPWLGILLFFLVIGAALFIKPRKPKKQKSKGKMGD
jgi:hypothetical protein